LFDFPHQHRRRSRVRTSRHAKLTGGESSYNPSS